MPNKANKMKSKGVLRTSILFGCGFDSADIPPPAKIKNQTKQRSQLKAGVNSLSKGMVTSRRPKSQNKAYTQTNKQTRRQASKQTPTPAPHKYNEKQTALTAVSGSRWKE